MQVYPTCLQIRPHCLMVRFLRLDGWGVEQAFKVSNHVQTLRVGQCIPVHTFALLFGFKSVLIALASFL